MNKGSFRHNIVMLSLVTLVTVGVPLVGRAQSDVSVVDAIRLVRAMEADRSVLLGMQLSLEREFREGRASRAQIECTRRVNSAVFTLSLAEALANMLNSEEAAMAIRFYESAAGRKYMQLIRGLAYERYGQDAPEPVPVFSDAEKAGLSHFAHSSVGDKFIRHNIMESPEMMKAYGPKILEIIVACKK